MLNADVRITIMANIGSNGLSILRLIRYETERSVTPTFIFIANGIKISISASFLMNP